MNDANKPASEFSRRSFLKTGSSAVVGGAFLGSLALERSVFAAPNDTLKIALIGCGGRGSGAADQALSTDGPTKLVAMADAFKDRLDGAANMLKKHGDKFSVSDENRFVGFDGYKKAIALADVVILATPPGFRPIHFEEAVRQGKHVFMEKPVAVDPVGVRKVLAAAKVAKEKNLKVGVGLQRRHQAMYLETIKRIQDGAIGDIVSSRAYWNDSGVWVKARQPEQSEMEYQMRNWYYFNWLCGDHITEQHIHNLDVINWVKNGHPVKAHGMGGRQVRNGIDHGEIFDHHAVEFEYADGSKLFSQCRHIPGCWSDVAEYVQGTKGKSEVARGVITGPTAWRYRNSGPNKNPYQQEHDDLFDAIRNNKEFNEAEFGATSTMTSILGRMATYSGQEIPWEKAINSDLDLMPETFAWDAKPKSLPDANGRYAIAIPGKTKYV